MTIAELAAALGEEIRRGNGSFQLFAFTHHPSSVIITARDGLTRTLVVTSYEPSPLKPQADVSDCVISGPISNLTIEHKVK